jgi:predicted nucleic acid-binding protein
VRMKRALLDTSVVVAMSQERLDIADPPEQVAISIVTLCELHHGVLVAGDERRAERLRGLDWARHHMETLPIEDDIAPRFGQLLSEARRATGARPEFADTLIAATAMLYDLPVFTRDRDFEAFPRIEVILV